MKKHSKIERFLTAAVFAPLVTVERKERERKLEQRLKDGEQRQKNLRVQAS